jgi:hypothetical protein
LLRSRSSSSSLIAGKTAALWLADIKAGNTNPTEVKVPESFRDGIVKARVHQGRDRFIASIRDKHVCNLAALYHDGDPCVFSRPSV